MDIGPVLLTAIIMAFIAWAVTYFSKDLGKSLAFLMALPLIIPFIILYFSAMITIPNAFLGNTAQAVGTDITAILKYWESNIVSVAMGAIAGLVVGAFASLFTGSHG